MATPDSPRLLRSLALLTLASGLIDAASVLGLGHVFTANMTGNVVFFGFALAGAARVSAFDCGVALVSFLLGALLGGRAAAKGQPFRRAIAFESALLIVAAAIAWWTADGPSARLPDIALLAVAMGCQNASVRKLGVADMTTTVLTLTLTGLAADSKLAGGINPHLIRRFGSVAVMFVGAFAGAVLWTRGVRWAISAAAAIVLAASFMVPPARPLTKASGT